ncbi:MAG: hypothetical protein AB199_00995 [Parcubacteria bacterium C7867-004]|nr:MAG: hypothetical protein AB199_00995 [Parcubacteria bacterium C7867-004]
MSHALTALDERSLKRVLIALSIYLTSLFAANTLGLKIMPFLFDSHLSVGVFMFPVVFLMTDVIGEVYGKKIAKFFVISGVISTALFIAYNLISIAMPWAAEGAWVQASYDQVFGISLRIAIASLIAYAVGEYMDVVAFFFTKDRMKKSRFWLSSFFSNVWSQAFDTVLFMGIAFYGIYPNEVLLSIMITWWLFKVAMGLLYTPLAYAGIALLKGKQHAGTAS